MTNLKQLRLLGMCLLLVSLNSCKVLEKNTIQNVLKSDRLIPKLEVNVQGSILTLRLINLTRNAIKVDRELVFAISLVAMDSENTYLSPKAFFATAPLMDQESKEKRFALIQPNDFIERTINLLQPIKAFEWGVADTMAITAYECFYFFTPVQVEQMNQIQVSYDSRQHMFQDGLRCYLGAEYVPNDLFEGPLVDCVVNVGNRVN
ncbi:MAG: hypothetical protein FWH21_02875 [Kiritimatiellaeota bacterium]|nr:hypothetical protein [Kiritimatiellota bacterium]